jgi:hypothetical protein
MVRLVTVTSGFLIMGAAAVRPSSGWFTILSRGDAPFS